MLPSLETCKMGSHQIKRVQRSGNEDKYIEETLKLYKDEMGEEFIFVSIWHFLKDKPEWKLQAMKKKEASKKEAPKKEAAAATTTTTATSTSPSTGDVVDVDADEEDCSLRPIGQKKAKELRNSAQRQLEIDEKAAQAMQSGAETHKFNLEFELFSSMGDTDEAKEWRGLVAQQILLDRKKAINAKKRVAEAEEACLKKKKEIAERLKKEVTPSAIEFDENEEENKENESRTNGNEEGEEEEVEESSPPEHCINNVSGTSSSEKSASSCCPLDLCHFANDDEEDVTFPLRNKCVMCKGFCHASCSKYAGQFVLCRLCDKKKERV